MIIYEDDYIIMSENNGKVYIKTLKQGFPIKKLDGILRKNPRVKLTNFALLKNVLARESDKQVEIGHWLPSVELEISRDKMTATIIVYDETTLLPENHDQLKAQIKDLLAKSKVVYGIKEIVFENILPGKSYTIAEGTPPKKGADAKVSYLEIPERKPVIREDGRADYFDMNFIFEIKKDAWLGEKIPAEQGIDGQNIHGEIIHALPGKDAPLKYDKKSAYEVEEDGKTVIRALQTGVLESRQGLLTVNNHLPIDGDVGIETGNIKFDGSISIRGTVQNGFSVTARGDISIEGPEGVTGAKLIQSTEGDIFIKGGIFGMNETVVEAGGSIFVKHVNDANLSAGKDIVIGFYSLGSNLVAGDSILLDERKGKIIGGHATAKNTIVTAISGNHLERRTELSINTINQQEGIEIIQEKAALLKTLQDEILQLSQQVKQLLQYREQLNDQQKKLVDQTEELLTSKKEYAVQLDREIKELMKEIRSKGKEEIVVTKEAHPGTVIQIGKKSSYLTKLTSGTFLIEFGELNV